MIPIPDSIYGTLFIDKEEYDNRLALREKLKSFISEKTQDKLENLMEELYPTSLLK